MNGRIVLAVVVAVIVYGVYSWFTAVDTFIPAPTSFAQAPPIQTPPSLPVKTVSPSGPAAPSQRPPKEAVMMPEEEARDPSDQGYESADLPDRLRHPERAFAPGLDNHGDAGEASGLAGQAQDVTLRSFQAFGPERVQNGGAFLESGVMANDMTLPTGYSEV
jgi:hypothetical protein